MLITVRWRFVSVDFSAQNTMKLASPFSSWGTKGSRGNSSGWFHFGFLKNSSVRFFSKNYCRSLPFGQFAQAGLSRAVARVSPLLRILSGWSTTNLFPCLLFGLAGLDQIFWNRFLLFLSPLFVFTFLSRLAEDSKWRLVKLPSCRLRIASE